MPRLDFYVLREYLTPFSVLIFAFSMLFLIGDVFNDVSTFLESDTPAGNTAMYFLLRMPGNIRFVLPITVLLSCMYTLANMGRHREITAMRASGISLRRCGVPMYVIAFLVMLVNFWFNETLVPNCTREAETLLRAAKNNETIENAQYVTEQYPSHDHRRNWLFGKFNADGIQENVRLKFFESEIAPDGIEIRKTVRQLDAEQAYFESGKGWTFVKCEERTYNRLGLMQVEKHEQLLVPESDAPDKPSSIMKALVEPEMLSAYEIHTFLGENEDLTPRIKNIYETYFYQHISFPWACFLCVFLALPLAAKNERSGIFLSIISAVGVIVAYQILAEVMLLFGKNGALPPVVAGLFPTLAFVGFGIYLAKKAG